MLGGPEHDVGKARDDTKDLVHPSWSYVQCPAHLWRFLRAARWALHCLCVGSGLRVLFLAMRGAILQASTNVHLWSSDKHQKT